MLVQELCKGGVAGHRSRQLDQGLLPFHPFLASIAASCSVCPALPHERGGSPPRRLARCLLGAPPSPWRHLLLRLHDHWLVAVQVQVSLHGHGRAWLVARGHRRVARGGRRVVDRCVHGGLRGLSQLLALLGCDQLRHCIHVPLHLSNLLARRPTHHFKVRRCARQRGGINAAGREQVRRDLVLDEELCQVLVTSHTTPSELIISRTRSWSRHACARPQHRDEATWRLKVKPQAPHHIGRARQRSNNT